MPKWMIRISRCFLIFSLLVSLGGHLALVQTLAWGSMLIDYSRGSSLPDALEKTFGGEHPCHLCKLVKDSQGDEKEKPILKSLMKIEMALTATVKVPFPRSEDLAFPKTAYFGKDLQSPRAVPVPPPRVA